MTYLSWIANFLNNLMDFLNCKIYNILVHPSGYLQLFNEHLFDVGHNLVTKVFCFGREGLLNKEATKDEP
jgi:hypothetical protein